MSAARMRPQIVVSVEQALSMSYATLRFRHLGWRVIRIEPTPRPGLRTKGDPNRYIGRDLGAGEDRHSYFVAPNVGKESLVLDLKRPEGQQVLHRLVRTLPADVFCTNTLPAHHRTLGFDYDTLRAVKPDLVWAGISAMGLSYPKVPGYDPMMQAQAGFMDLTGHADGPPLQCGPPITDYKAGDEVYAGVLLALWQREVTGQGQAIDVSMAHGAVSWLHTFTPMLDMGSPPDELRRAGNEHRQFIPVNAYETADGWIYIAIGSDVQWKRVVAQPLFASLDEAQYATNEGRRADKDNLFRRIGEITRRHDYDTLAAALAEAKVPYAPITAIEDVPGLDFYRRRQTHTVTPGGREIRLPPPAVETEHLAEADRALPFAPAYGEHTDAILDEIGYDAGAIADLRQQGVVA